MLDTLLASRAARGPWSGRIALGSLAVHGLIAAAVVRAPPRGEVAPTADAPVLTVAPYHAPAEAAARAASGPLLVAPAVLAPDLSRLPVGLDVPVRAGSRLGAGPAPALAPSGSALVEPPPGDTRWAAMADEPPELLVGGRLHYPRALREAGIEGRIIVEAVIDTLGRTEAGSLRVLGGGHAGLAAAAVRYVRRALFRPARVGGRPVRVRIRLPVDFVLVR
jgi:TonB family protein